MPFCVNCGREYSSRENFCVNCGKKINITESTYSNNEIENFIKKTSLSLFDIYKFAIIENYANFKGRASRKEYWSVFLIHFILLFPFVLIYGFIPNLLDIITFFYSLFIIIPGTASVIRRFHDINVSGYFILVGFVPIFGALLILYFLLKSGTDGINDYGIESPIK